MMTGRAAPSAVTSWWPNRSGPILLMLMPGCGKTQAFWLASLRPFWLTFWSGAGSRWASGLNLEIKCHGGRQDRTAQQLASVLQQTATDGIVVSSFDVYFLQILRQSMPDLRLASIHDEPVQMSKLLAGDAGP